MKIDYPSEAEIRRSINQTIENAWLKEKRENGILSMIKHIGIDNIIFGMKKYAAAVPMIYISIICLKSNLEYRFDDGGESFMVFLMPLMFMGIIIMGVINDKEQNVYELAMTYRYTPYHILGLRVIAVCVFITVSNGVLLLLASVIDGISYLIQTALLSVTVTMIYSTLYIRVLTGGTGWGRQILLYGGWMAVNILANKITPDVYFYLLRSLPAIYHAAIWIVMLIIGLKELKRYMEYGFRYNSCVGGL